MVGIQSKFSGRVFGLCFQMVFFQENFGINKKPRNFPEKKPKVENEDSTFFTWVRSGGGFFKNFCFFRTLVKVEI